MKTIVSDDMLEQDYCLRSTIYHNLDTVRDILEGRVKHQLNTNLGMMTTSMLRVGGDTRGKSSA